MRSKKPKLKQGELDEYLRQEAELRKQIEELQGFLEEAPEKIKQDHIEQMSTMPAPDDLFHRQRERRHNERLTKGELKNERRQQARSILLMLLLIAAIATTTLWIYRTVNG